MLTSKEVLERTGISRATLHNYIATGLVQRPDVMPPHEQDGAAPRIGYFPDSTVERIEEIQRLKRSGWSIARIAQHFAEAPASGAVPESGVAPAGAGAPVPVTRSAAGMPAAPGASPSIRHVVTLASTLQDAPRLWTRLPAIEYFELVGEVWAELDPIFRRHGGTAGRHPDEGLVSYFFPQPAASYLWNALAAADEARTAMRALSRRWQMRKAWDFELHMNIGIDEGRDWVGSAGNAELRVLGDAADRALQLSRLCRDGAILATRGFVGKLTAAEGDRLTFGVPRDGAPPLLFTFARLQDIAAAEMVPPRLAELAVAHVLELGPRDEAPPAPQAQQPTQ